VRIAGRLSQPDIERGSTSRQARNTNSEMTMDESVHDASQMDRGFRDLSGLSVYRELIEICERIDSLAERAMSPTTETALRSTAQVIRLLASAVYRTTP